MRASETLTQNCGEFLDTLAIHDVVQQQSTVHAGNNVTIYLLRPLDPAVGHNIEGFKIKLDEANSIDNIVD